LGKDQNTKYHQDLVIHNGVIISRLAHSDANRCYVETCLKAGYTQNGCQVS